MTLAALEPLVSPDKPVREEACDPHVQQPDGLQSVGRRAARHWHWPTSTRRVFNPDGPEPAE
jgi:hypothetical protein